MLVSARSPPFSNFYIRMQKPPAIAAEKPRRSCSLARYSCFSSGDEATCPLRAQARRRDGSCSNLARKQPLAGFLRKLAGCVDINHDDYTLASYASRLEIVVNPISKFEPGNWREITAMPRETRQTSRMCLSWDCCRRHNSPHRLAVKSHFASVRTIPRPPPSPSPPHDNAEAVGAVRRSRRSPAERFSLALG